MVIYIPSIGRADRVKTLSKMPDKWLKKTYLVVPEKEVDAYGYKKIIAVPNRIKGIAATRQYILENSKENLLLMLDDDLRFCARKSKTGIKLREATPNDVDKIFSIMEAWLKKGYAHVGLASRPEASFYIINYRECTRVNNFHGYNRKIIMKENIKFNERGLKLMEDFHVTLSLLERGYPNRVLYDYQWDQNASNSSGGCSLYRNNDLQEKSAKLLKKLHPEYVEMVTRKSTDKNSWGGMKVRADVRIAWHKAFGYNHHWEIEKEFRRKK